MDDSSGGKCEPVIVFECMDLSQAPRGRGNLSEQKPTIEYASTFWDSYKTDDINCLYKVQCRVARYACNNYTERTPGCVTTMVSSLGCESLQDHQKMNRLTMLYKIKHNLVEVPDSSFGQTTAEHECHRGFSSHTPMLQCTKSRFSLGPKQDWNKLPSTITDIQI